MKINYEERAKVMKAIADPKRLQIIDILSCGEKCACEILEDFDFTQPTLSHHMKVLSECGLVKCRKEGAWTHYSLDEDNCNDLLEFLKELTSDTEECICKNKKECSC